MTTNETTRDDIQPDDILSFDGRRVIVIAADPDPSALVWTVDALDPDISLWVDRRDLEPVENAQ